MKNNLKILQALNNTEYDYSININSLQLKCDNYLKQYLSNNTTTIYNDETGGEIININLNNNILTNNTTVYSIFSGSKKKYTNIKQMGIPDNIPVQNQFLSEDRIKYCEPNTNKNMSFIMLKQEFDMNFLLNRFDVYDKLDAIQNLFITNYESGVIDGIVIQENFTFISNLKLLSKDIQFDQFFKDNKTTLNEYLLDSIKLTVSDNTNNEIEWLGTTFDLNELNLNKLNIGIINSQDQYVSYKISNLSIEEKLFIKNKCKLAYKFVNRYNSNIFTVVYKKIYIGK